MAQPTESTDAVSVEESITVSRTVNTNGRGKFERGYNAGTGDCRHCGKRTQAGILRQQSDLCDTCWSHAGLESEHQDGYHNADQNDPDAACPMCRAAQPEDSGAEVAAPPVAAHRTQPRSCARAHGCVRPRTTPQAARRRQLGQTRQAA